MSNCHPLSIACLLALPAAAGCAADLSLGCTELDWSDEVKRARTVITNTGQRSARDVVVVFTPRSEEGELARAYVEVPAGTLAAGERITVEADLASLADAGNAYLAEVHSVELVVDPLDVVRERNEANNRRVVDLRGAVLEGAEPLLYDQNLPTVLRGVVIDEEVGARVGVVPGYYEIGVQRVWNTPEDMAVVLFVHHLPAHASEREEPLVFGDLAMWDWTPEALSVEGCDLSGNRLSIRVEFGSATGQDCNRVTATLNGRAIEVSTQTIHTERLNSCGWTPETEPPWSRPRP